MKVSLKYLKFLEQNGEKIKEIFKDEIGIAYAEIKESKLHYHTFIHEWYIVVEGYGRLYLDEKVILIEKDDIVHIPPGVKHKVEGDPVVKVYVISNPAWRKEDHMLVSE